MPRHKIILNAFSAKTRAQKLDAAERKALGMPPKKYNVPKPPPKKK